MGKEDNLKFMEGYLRHAMEFEKYVYIWSNAMNKANSQMKRFIRTEIPLSKIKMQPSADCQRLRQSTVKSRLISTEERICSMQEPKKLRKGQKVLL